MKALFILTYFGFFFLNPTFAQLANTNLSTGIAFDGEPYLAVNPSNPQNLIAAWIGVKFVNGALSNVIKTKSSFNGGTTWSAGNNLPHFAPTHGSADPSIAFSTSGTAYLSYIDFRKTPDSGAVYVARSTNGGLNWDTPSLALDMYDLSSEKPIDRPWLVIDNSTTSSNGTLYLTTMPPSFVAPPNRPYYKVSTDGGFTWSALANLDGPGYLTGGGIQAAMATPAVTKDGKFIALYPSFVPSQNPLPAYYLANSIDQGQTFTYSTVLSTLPSSSNVNFKKGYLLLADPSDGDKMVFLSPSASNGDSDITATHSNDGGQNWSSQLRVNDDLISNGKAQDMVWGAYNQTSDLVVTWRDRRNASVNDFWGAGYDFYYAVSFDNGQTFGANQKLTSEFIAFDSLISESGNDFMSCTFSGDTLYTVWGDTRNGKMNIYFAKTLVSSNSTISTFVLEDNSSKLFVFPNPAGEEIQVKSAASMIGKTYLVYDSFGHIVQRGEAQKELITLSCKRLKSGTYFLTIGEEHSQFIVK